MFGFKRPALAQIQHLLLHIGIGFVVSQLEIMAKLYFFGILVYFVYQIIKQPNKTYYALGGAAYIASAEIFLRMTNAMPFWEMGKYMVIFFMLLGMLYQGFKLKAWPILVFLGLLLPGVIVTYLNFDYFEESFRKAILFNLSGPLSLFATALFCYHRQIKFDALLKLVDLMILPIVAMVVYIILYIPLLEQIVFTTESNPAASGGYGGNQVATILGFGMFLTYVRFLIPYRNLLLNIINVCLLGLFTYRCLLTFSRGGFITALIMIAIFTVLFLYWAPLAKKGKATVKLVGLGVGGFLLWGVVVSVTGGLIVNRYAGENALGEEKDITTGRGEIISEELGAFMEDPFLGVGVGMGKFFRYELDGDLAASHNEVTRMLAEHGLLGILALLILLLIPLGFLLSKNRNLLMLPFVAFWFLTINHSAMRVALPGFIYGLALLNITYASKKQRKRKSHSDPKKLLYLGNKLSREGRNVSSVEVLSSQLNAEGYKVTSGSSQKNLTLRLLDMLYLILKHHSKSDLLLIDTYSTKAFWYAYTCGRLAQMLKLDYIPILHGGNLPQRLKSHPKHSRQLFCKAKVNVAPSRYLMHEFEQFGIYNVIYIPNSIELKNYSYKKRSQLQPHLLWVRSFAQIYNPMLALKVLQKILKSYPEAKLSMVGPFKDESIDKCKAYAKAHVLPVTFTGGMPKADWLAYAQDFDIFINTTNVDNTPVSVIEAMALGLPVVSTNVGGIPYLLEDEVDALLVQPDEVETFTEAVLRLLNDTDLASQLSKTGRQKVEHFDWDVVKGKWFAVIGD